MAKDFSEIIDVIMPLVNNGSDLPFAITHENGGWNINYFALNTTLSQEEMQKQSAGFLALLRESDPYAVRHTGAEFAKGSFAFVYDDVLRARFRAEYDAEPFGNLNGGEFMALIEAFEDNIGSFSQNAIDYLLQFDQPLHTLHDLNPISLYNRDNSDNQPYDANKIEEFVEAVEYKIEEIINLAKDVQHEQSVPGTTFEKIIDKLQPEVATAGNEPLLIYRDTDGGWHCDFTQNQYGETFDWVEDAMNSDKAAVLVRGQDFKNSDKCEISNEILCLRLRNEYHMITVYDANAEHKKIYALLNFFEDNVAEFSPETLDYLTEVDRPLAFLTKMCPYNLDTNRNDWSYNKTLAADAVYRTEQRISDIINAPKDVSEIRINKIQVESKRVIDGHYTEKFSVALAGREVFLAIDEKDDAPYLVCTARWDNPLNMTEYFDGEVTDDYIEAMREFVDRIDTLLGNLEQERGVFLTVQPTLTSADCVPGGLDKDLTGTLVVIKPEVLSPEYRSANHQLKIVKGGFGANPNARGNAVFCADLYSGKETRFERYDIAGVIDPGKLPEWAKEKLAYLEALKESNVFAFGDYHFKPYRKFGKKMATSISKRII
jgi:hypothetical protein